MLGLLEKGLGVEEAHNGQRKPPSPDEPLSVNLRGGALESPCPWALSQLLRKARESPPLQATPGETGENTSSWPAATWTSPSDAWPAGWRTMGLVVVEA